MKFVSDYDDIKKNYLYELRDSTDKILILLISKSFVNKKFKALNLKKGNYNDFTANIISKFKEFEESFSDSKWACYEIGPKDMYPEYFI